MKSNGKERSIKNGLSKKYNAYFRYKIEDIDGEKKVITRGVGHKKEGRGNEHYSIVEKKQGKKPGSLKIDKSDLPSEYSLLIIIKIKSEDEYYNLKVIPGKLGIAHHTEYHFKYHNKNKYVVIIIKYKKFEDDEENHVDPQVEHPDPPGEIPYEV